ncbi:hypothetical protein F5884DRAFT_814978 [Xylogone sp. PMI_703]|nr:hypothetical protein F5884DRAFT_814978 [Xylogone sp. PMI_703]
MVINWAILVISLLFGYGFATGSEVPAEVTVQIQYNGEEGSGIITMTRPTPTHEAFITTSFQSTKNALGTGTTSVFPALGYTSSPTSPFNMPPVFGASRTQMVNSTSSTQHRSPTAKNSSRVIGSSIATQNSPGPAISQINHSGTTVTTSRHWVVLWALGEIGLSILVL